MIRPLAKYKKVQMKKWRLIRLASANDKVGEDDQIKNGDLSIATDITSSDCKGTSRRTGRRWSCTSRWPRECRCTVWWRAFKECVAVQKPAKARLHTIN